MASLIQLSSQGDAEEASIQREFYAANSHNDNIRVKIQVERRLESTAYSDNRKSEKKNDFCAVSVTSDIVGFGQLASQA